MALQAGRLFGNYRVVRLIGEGAFGEVYLAENPLIERRAAIKVLRPLLAQDAELVRRFFNEARAASAIRHPSIIEVFDAGETPEGFPYILMEFLEGKSLKKRLAEAGRLSVAEALEIAGQAGSALAAAHAIGIVHRDLKPENLFLVPDAGAPSGARVKILDFGIAKVKHGVGPAGSIRTETGLIMGSPTYMSPEQCKDSADVDLRADIYSLATIVYEMMAGRPPYVGATGVELLLMHLSETPRPLRELAPHVPDHVQDAVMRALHQERSERFDGIPGFLRALTQGIGGAHTATPVSGNALAAGPGSGSDVDRAVAVPAPSTFSPSNAEVVAESGSSTYRTARSLQRWLVLTSGGLIVIAFALLLLFRHGQHTSPTVAPGVTATPTVAVVPIHSPPKQAAPAVLAGKADAGAKPLATSEIPRDDNAHHAVAATRRTAKQRQATPRARPSSIEHASTVSRHRFHATPSAAPPEQEDVAGF